MKKTIIETKTVLVNTRNYAKTGVYFTADEIVTNEDGIRHFLTRNDGEEVVVADSTFKRYYKSIEIQVETEIEVEEPKAETKPLSKHQKVAAENIKNAYSWIVGGYQNSVLDGNAEEMPSIEEMFTEVLEEANSGEYSDSWVQIGHAPAAMQFAGRKFVRETLADLFKADGYEVPAELLKVPEKHKAVGPRKNIKGNPENVGDDEVVMRAFTGMLIGVFQIVDQSKDHITVELANGIRMEFNRHTGIQADAANPRFANRIEI